MLLIIFLCTFLSEGFHLFYEEEEGNMGREENKLVFQDTARLCKENTRLMESVKNATANQKMYPEGEEISVGDLKIFDEPAKVSSLRLKAPP